MVFKSDGKRAHRPFLQLFYAEKVGSDHRLNRRDAFRRAKCCIPVEMRAEGAFAAIEVEEFTAVTLRCVVIAKKECRRKPIKSRELQGRSTT